MAVTRVLEKISARLKLNNGTSPSTGQVLTVNQSLPALTNVEANIDDTKILAVATAVSACLTKSVYSVEVVPTYTLVD